MDDPFDASRDELTLSPTMGGLGIIGWFHTAAGIEIQNPIDSYDEPDPQNREHAPRTLAERRAVALYALLFDGRATAPKNIDVPIDEATLRGEWTDAHHVVAYFGGGLSDLANYALVCRRHHRMLDRGWTLARAPGGGWTFDPLQDRAPHGDSTRLVTDPPRTDPPRSETRTPSYV